MTYEKVADSSFPDLAWYQETETMFTLAHDATCRFWVAYITVNKERNRITLNGRSVPGESKHYEIVVDSVQDGVALAHTVMQLGLIPTSDHRRRAKL